MDLPQPTIDFTIPSLHDEVSLECRVYHPRCIRPFTHPNQKPQQWHRDIAIVAHPYAPLGGSRHDAVVETIAGTLLRREFLVATFNFRGAGQSGGRTSWTSKPEQADYASIVGFLLHYAHHLDPLGDVAGCGDDYVGEPGLQRRRPICLLAGYSYGALVTSLLPPLGELLSRFEKPSPGTAAVEIKARAEHLAEQQTSILARLRAAASIDSQADHGLNGSGSGSSEASQTQIAAARKSLSVRVGGDELRRTSYEQRRSASVDSHGVRSPRKSFKQVLDESKRRVSSRGRKPRPSQDVERPKVQGPRISSSWDAAAVYREVYLLVSPPLNMLSTLLTMSSSSLFKGASTFAAAEAPEQMIDHARHEEQSSKRNKLQNNPSLLVYGDKDGFVNVKKYRTAAAKLRSATETGVGLRTCEVATAGHFYMEEGAMLVLHQAVDDFAQELLREGAIG